VSTATVSNVLRGTKAATPRCVARPRRRRRLGYVPNPHAQSLRTGHSRALGVVVPDLTNPFFPALVQAIETTAREPGLRADRHGRRQRRRPRGERRWRCWPPTGSPASSGSRSTGRPHDWPFPIVTVDRPLPCCDAVIADHAQGGALVARHAIELGHRRVGLLSGPLGAAERGPAPRGFLEAAAGRSRWPGSTRCRSRATCPRRRPRACGARLQPVACANDAIAVGALRALRAAGLRVPDDVSVIGFDDVPWAEFVEPALTTVRQPLAALGAARSRCCTPHPRPVRRPPLRDAPGRVGRAPLGRRRPRRGCQPPAAPPRPRTWPRAEARHDRRRRQPEHGPGRPRAALPAAAGETLLGGDYARHPGGKGANQAVAAARAGGAVRDGRPRRPRRLRRRPHAAACARTASTPTAVPRSPTPHRRRLHQRRPGRAELHHRGAGRERPARARGPPPARFEGAQRSCCSSRSRCPPCCGPPGWGGRPAPA
jgi:LacI family transcriptional regulator